MIGILRLKWVIVLIGLSAVGQRQLSADNVAPQAASTSTRTADGDSEVPQPCTSPKYFTLVQALAAARESNEKACAKSVASSTGKPVNPEPWPIHYRARTAAEVEKMGPLCRKSRQIRMPHTSSPRLFWKSRVLGINDLGNPD